MRLLLLTSLAFIGCASSNSGRISKAEVEARRAAEEKANRGVAEEKQEKCDAGSACDVESKNAETEHLHNVNYPVVTELTSPEYRAKFEKVVCGGRSIKSSPCQRKYEDTFIAKLQETYPLAQAKSLVIWCKANPMDCGDWDKIEDQYRDSNAGMNTVARTEREERDARTESAHQRRILNILTRHRTGTACTKTVDGNTVRTECD